MNRILCVSTSSFCRCFLAISNQICRWCKHSAPAHYLLLKVWTASPGIVLVVDGRKGNCCSGQGSIRFVFKTVLKKLGNLLGLACSLLRVSVTFKQCNKINIPRWSWHILRSKSNEHTYLLWVCHIYKDLTWSHLKIRRLFHHRHAKA